MPDSSDWILKIISGPHQGAEVALRAGRSVVGAHPECDLVLHDVLVAPQHFALLVEAAGVRVEPIDGRVFCNGRRATAPTPVPAFGFITAGTTHVVVGPAGARWPLLSPADVPELEKEPPAAAESAAGGEEKPATEASAGKPARKPPGPEVRRRALWSAGAGGVLLLIWLLLWLKWVPQSAVAPHAGLQERARQLLATFPEGDAIALETQGDRVSATGYVGSDAAQREISTAFREQLPEVTLRLWSTPRLVETARSLLQSHQIGLEVDPARPGELRVRGHLAGREAWTQARQLLLAEVPGLQRLGEEITFDDAPAGAAAGTGAAPASAQPVEKNRWEGVTVVALQELGEGQGWLRLSNGAVVFRGARLPEAGRLTAVQEGHAVIENGAARFTLSLGDEVAAALRAPAAPGETAPQTAAVAPETALARQTPPPNG